MKRFVNTKALSQLTSPKPPQNQFTVWAAVFDIEHAVHEQGQAEAGPEHGEAEDGAHPPGHHAGGGRGHCDNTCMTSWAWHLHRMTPKVRRWSMA